MPSFADRDYQPPWWDASLRWRSGDLIQDAKNNTIFVHDAALMEEWYFWKNQCEEDVVQNFRDRLKKPKKPPAAFIAGASPKRPEVVPPLNLSQQNLCPPSVVVNPPVKEQAVNVEIKTDNKKDETVVTASHAQPDLGGSGQDEKAATSVNVVEHPFTFMATGASADFRGTGFHSASSNHSNKVKAGGKAEDPVVLGGKAEDPVVLVSLAENQADSKRENAPAPGAVKQDELQDNVIDNNDQKSCNELERVPALASATPAAIGTSKAQASSAGTGPASATAPKPPSKTTPAGLLPNVSPEQKPNPNFFLNQDTPRELQEKVHEQAQNILSSEAQKNKPLEKDSPAVAPRTERLQPNTAFFVNHANKQMQNVYARGHAEVNFAFPAATLFREAEAVEVAPEDVNVEEKAQGQEETVGKAEAESQVDNNDVEMKDRTKLNEKEIDCFNPAIAADTTAEADHSLNRTWCFDTSAKHEKENVEKNETAQIAGQQPPPAYHAPDSPKPLVDSTLLRAAPLSNSLKTRITGMKPPRMPPLRAGTVSIGFQPPARFSAGSGTQLLGRNGFP
ncbi:unnamed protein product, partial [Amoebophrya sp. A120]|eukprot:GSA120T00010761001.1